MDYLDWLVLVGTLVAITIYGIYRGRKATSMGNYLGGNKQLPAYHVAFSVIATQASAITFLSAPGQAYTDGMRFIQFYFGMPLAMIVICVYFLPKYTSLNVITAYQYLESRFDKRVKATAATLFLLLRSLSSGLTVYAPALVLSSVMGWNIYLSIILMGILVITYTVSGGAEAVAHTQLQQMTVIIIGMGIAAYMIVAKLPEQVSVYSVLQLAAIGGKMNPISTELNLNDKYNIWSGIIGGFFLALSYFGTDQSQVGRYLSGRNIEQSRIGLLVTGFVKIPIQFCILLIGLLLYGFYYFNPAPLIFNPQADKQMALEEHHEEYATLQHKLRVIEGRKAKLGYQLVSKTAKDDRLDDQINSLAKDESEIRKQAKELVKKDISAVEANDTNYIFLHFVFQHLPHGLIGLLIAVIFCASWNSTSSELNALASTTLVDILPQRLLGFNMNSVVAGKTVTALWGVFAMVVAMFASTLGSLIEAVNQLGSLFYGTILGIFLTALFVKTARPNGVLVASAIAQIAVFICFITNAIAFLWFNVLACFLVVFLSFLFSGTKKHGVFSAGPSS